VEEEYTGPDEDGVPDCSSYHFEGGVASGTATIKVNDDTD